jgi:hypothetical protein
MRRQTSTRKGAGVLSKRYPKSAARARNSYLGQKAADAATPDKAADAATPDKAADAATPDKVADAATLKMDAESGDGIIPANLLMKR